MDNSIIIYLVNLSFSYTTRSVFRISCGKTIPGYFGHNLSDMFCHINVKTNVNDIICPFVPCSIFYDIIFEDWQKSISESNGIQPTSPETSV